jgi:hypothetical protein
MPYSVASGSGSATSYHEQTSDDSILRAMEGFVNSYDRMTSTIMIPSRLKDMPVTVQFQKGTTQLPTFVTGHAPHKLVLSNGKTELKEIDMYTMYEVLLTVRQELAMGLEAPSMRQPRTMRKPTSAALVRQADGSCGNSRDTTTSNSGRTSPDSQQQLNNAELDIELASNSLNGLGDQQQQVAALFRQHLQGLFTVLHQMTDAADLLSKTYLDVVGN